MMDLKSEISKSLGLEALHFNQKDNLKGRFLPVYIVYLGTFSSPSTNSKHPQMDGKQRS